MLKGLHKWYDNVPEPQRVILCIFVVGLLLWGISTCPFWVAIPCAAILATIVFSRIAYLKDKG